jgi:hypothetical protein
MLDRFGLIITALAGMLERFLDVCDCVHASFAGDQALDQLPQPAYLGRTRLGGIDINRLRARAALAAALALATCPAGFTAVGFTAKVQAITGDPATPPGKVPATSASCAPRTSSPAKAGPGATPPARRSPHHRAHRHPARSGPHPCLTGVRASALAPSPLNPATADQPYQKLRSQMRGAAARLRPHGRITATNV